MFLTVDTRHIFEHCFTSTVVPAQGRVEATIDYIRFSSIELACALCHRGPCMRALCEPVVLFRSRGWPAHNHVAIHRQATLCASKIGPRSHITLHTFTLHTRTSHFTPYFTLHTLRFTLHTSSHLNSSRLISSLLTCHLSFSHLIRTLLYFLTSSKLFVTHRALLYAIKLFTVQNTL